MIERKKLNIQKREYIPEVRKPWDDENGRDPEQAW